MATKPWLLAIPPELRDAIWTLAVVTPDPLPADYAVKHTRPAAKHWRSRTITSMDHMRRLVLGKKDTELHAGSGPTPTTSVSISPGFPSLAYVNRQIRQEALAVFFHSNVFLFSRHRDRYDYASYRQVQRWQIAPVLQNAARLARLDFFSLWTVCMECMVGSSTGRPLASANVECRLNPECRLAITFTGALTEECTCRCRKMAEQLGRTAEWAGDQSKLIMKFMGFVEDELRDEWSRTWRRNGSATRCAECSMPCWDSRIPSERPEGLVEGRRHTWNAPIARTSSIRAT